MSKKEQFDINVENERLNKHKDLLEQVHKLNAEFLHIQEEKFKNLCNFLEYEEALTKDKETAARITEVLKEIQLWK
jgi:uncharacterized protein YunC (DUF1805 family)